MQVDDIVTMVLEANPNRDSSNLSRRILKMQEELGEVSEAYLNASSMHPNKEKTYDDVREELIDVIIVALDCALTPMPGHPIDSFYPRLHIIELMQQKLAKWENNRKSGKVVTDDV